MDPGFPRGGGTNSLGAPTYDFAKFSKKMHEFENSLDCWEGVHAGDIAIDPPLVMSSFDQNIGSLSLILIVP